MKKKIRFASVSDSIWGFYDAYDDDHKECMADWFETLLTHYRNRGKRIKKLIKSLKENKKVKD